MADKTAQQLQDQIDLDSRLEIQRQQERQVSDKIYAAKIVEKIVFWTIAALALGVISLMFDLIAKHFNAK